MIAFVVLIVVGPNVGPSNKFAFENFYSWNTRDIHFRHVEIIFLLRSVI